MADRITSHRLSADEHDQLRLIACEIHDGLCQHLSVGIAYLTTWADMRSTPPERGDDLFDRGMQALRVAMDECRGIVNRLRFRCPQQLCLVEAVSQLIRDSHWCDALDVTFHHDLAGRALSAEAAHAAFRIIQESLSNVARHSRSDSARVEAVAVGDVLRILIEDQGVGFDQKRKVDADRFGIEAMCYRAERSGGRFAIESRPGGGTRVRAEIPILGSPP